LDDNNFNLKEQKLQINTQQEQREEVVSKKLAETTEEKITFFTNITHEFRTPVTLINGPIEQAIKSNKDPEVNQQLKLAERSSKYLLALVNELMDFRKIDAQKVQLDKKCEDFEIFLENAVIPFKAFAGDRNISLNILYHLSNNYIVLDYDYMKRVIVNLVSNAIKFTPGGGFVTLSAKSKPKRKVEIVIADNGIGMEREMIENLFKINIETGRAGTNGEPSTGLGLLICKEFIERHNGTLEVESEKEKGSRFIVTLPL
jgi:signal transduction histidine kinase